MLCVSPLIPRDSEGYRVILWDSIDSVGFHWFRRILSLRIQPFPLAVLLCTFTMKYPIWLSYKIFQFEPQTFDIPWAKSRPTEHYFCTCLDLLQWIASWTTTIEYRSGKIWATKRQLDGRQQGEPWTTASQSEMWSPTPFHGEGNSRKRIGYENSSISVIPRISSILAQVLQQMNKENQ